MEASSERLSRNNTFSHMSKTEETEAQSKRTRSATEFFAKLFSNKNVDKCSSCGNQVYPVEKLKLDERLFHKGCFRCSQCNTQLTLSDYASFNGLLFCKVHARQSIRFSIRDLQTIRGSVTVNQSSTSSGRDLSYRDIVQVQRDVRNSETQDSPSSPATANEVRNSSSSATVACQSTGREEEVELDAELVKRRRNQRSVAFRVQYFDREADKIISPRQRSQAFIGSSDRPVVTPRTKLDQENLKQECDMMQALIDNKLKLKFQKLANKMADKSSPRTFEAQTPQSSNDREPEHRVIESIRVNTWNFQLCVGQYTDTPHDVLVTPTITNSEELQALLTERDAELQNKSAFEVDKQMGDTTLFRSRRISSGNVLFVSSETLKDASHLKEYLRKIVSSVLQAAALYSFSSIAFSTFLDGNYGIPQECGTQAIDILFKAILNYCYINSFSNITNIGVIFDKEIETATIQSIHSQLLVTQSEFEAKHSRHTKVPSLRINAGFEENPLVMYPSSDSPSLGREPNSYFNNGEYLLQNSLAFESILGSVSPAIDSSRLAALDTPTSTQRALQGNFSLSNFHREAEMTPEMYYDINISAITYSIPPDDESNIEFIRENNIEEIKCATLDKLIERLTYHTAYDASFLYAFLLTYRSFTTPEQLLQKLKERYYYPPSQDLPFRQFKKNFLDHVRLRVVQAIKQWIEKHSYDFRSDMKLVLAVEEFCVNMSNTNMDTAAKSILRSLDRNVKSQTGRPSIAASGRRNSNGTGSHTSFFFAKKTPFDWPSLDVAKQMTMLEFELFQKIQPKECMNQSWSKSNKEERAPNICSMINRFNLITKWCGTEIVKTTDLKKRARILKKLIKIAKGCQDLNNLNGVFEIVSGITCASIFRLQKTWDCLDTKHLEIFKDLQALVSRDGNFKRLRELVSVINPPCIPYIGLYLSDLTFIDDGNPDLLNGKINFIKRRKLAKRIRDIQTYQQTPYYIERIPEICEYIEKYKSVEENEMYKMSLEIEPRQ